MTQAKRNRTGLNITSEAQNKVLYAKWHPYLLDVGNHDPINRKQRQTSSSVARNVTLAQPASRKSLILELVQPRLFRAVNVKQSLQ